MTASALAPDQDRLSQLFGRAEGLLPLWIAEPYLEPAPGVQAALASRAGRRWYGYETRPDSLAEAFWSWMQARQNWDRAGLETLVSPGIGTSIGVLLDLFTKPSDGVILQTPVFTDFKQLVVSSGRTVVRNSLELAEGGYRMDLQGLAEQVWLPRNRLLILCNPHNPVGRLWSRDELRVVAELCAKNKVFVIADEIHADLVLGDRDFTPFAQVAEGTGVSWAALHGPIKTFGLAGVCDSLLITDSEELRDRFHQTRRRYHLVRNNIFSKVAFEAAYREGADWLGSMLGRVAQNIELLKDGLPSGIKLVEPEATYLAWLDFRELGYDVPKLVERLVETGLALSPGHWFGREGAGFARMTIATEPEVTEEALKRLARI